MLFTSPEKHLDEKDFSPSFFAFYVIFERLAESFRKDRHDCIIHVQTNKLEEIFFFDGFLLFFLVIEQKSFGVLAK